MVEKIMQLGADILDKEGTGVESALYIFVPSLMSDQGLVWRTCAAPGYRPPPPLLESAQYARNNRPREQLWLFLCTSWPPEEAREKLAHYDRRGCSGGRWVETRLPRPWEVA